MLSITPTTLLRTDLLTPASLTKSPKQALFEWPAFSKQEFRDAIAKCSSLSAPEPDYISWKHLKTLLSSNLCLEKIVNVTDTCINLEFWPSHFKATNTIIIPKPNKELYSIPKSFYPIILLNTAGKLIEKVISNRL